MRDIKLDILDLLEEDAKRDANEIALMLGVSESEVAGAIAELEEQKVIVKYVAVVNREVLDENNHVEALIEVKVTPQREYGYDDLAKRIYKFEEVKSVSLMAGSYDLAVRIQSHDIKSISKFVFEKLAVIDGVTSTVTVFIMRKYKENGVILVNDETDERLVVTP
ncbi:MAG: Lrp/AsnC family transcriptional regulator [Eubacteriales bacterium]